MANKKSLDAKAYINGKVNDMREQFVKVTDKGAKKQLVETFKKTTSSDEYQENLAIVNEDTDAIRKYAKRKKGGDITSEEFKDAKTEFYGKDMNLNLGEDFEKLSKNEQCKYIIDKFGYTQYSFDCLLKYKVVPYLKEEDWNNFSNLNNSSAQNLLKNKSYEIAKIFFVHIGSFGDFNETTLNILTENLPYHINYMKGSFSKEDTNYILNHINFNNFGITTYRELLINYNKFTFGKGKDGLESMIKCLYTKLNRKSKGIFLDIIDEFLKRKNKESFERYKMLPKNIKIIKVLDACSPLFYYECDKILLLDAVWKNKDVLEWYIKKYNKYTICNRLNRNVADPQHKDIGISEDMLLQAQKRLQSMNEK